MVSFKLVKGGIAFFTILLLSYGPFIDPVSSYESVEQDRAICLRDCREKFGYLPYWGGGGRGGVNEGNWRLYFKCIDDCEKKFWKEWQKEHDELENE
jgi:hypothetical protein